MAPNINPNAEPGKNKIKRPKLIRFGDLIKPKIKLPPPKPQDLPLRYRDFIRNSNADEASVRLILVKTLEETDVSPHQARLSLPKEKIRARFLSPEEEEFVKGSSTRGGRVLRNKLEVKVVDHGMSVRTMKLAKWNDVEPRPGEKKKSWWFALTGDWVKVVRENGLGQGVTVQVWSFRSSDGGLGFIIHKIESGEGSGSGSGSSTDRGNGDEGSSCKRMRSN